MLKVDKIIAIRTWSSFFRVLKITYATKEFCIILKSGWWIGSVECENENLVTIFIFKCTTFTFNTSTGHQFLVFRQALHFFEIVTFSGSDFISIYTPEGHYFTWLPWQCHKSTHRSQLPTVSRGDIMMYCNNFNCDKVEVASTRETTQKVFHYDDISS